MGTRRTQLTQHALLCTERDALEAVISEQQAYNALQAQGSEGARTEFANLPSLTRSLDVIMNKIATVERSLEL